MAGLAKPRGGKKNRKWGRNKVTCQAYRMAGRREKNKRAKLLKHLQKFPDDKGAKAALANLK